MESLLSNAEKAFVLRSIRTTIEKPEQWTKGVEARNSDGYPVQPWEEGTVSFCLMGATSHVPGVSRAVGIEVLGEMLGELPDLAYWGIADFNDARDRRHIEVLQKLDEGIKKFDPTYVPPRMSLWARFKSWKCKG